MHALLLTMTARNPSPADPNSAPFANLSRLRPPSPSLIRLERPHIRDHLPDLWVAQLRPRRHPILHAAVREQPMQIALGRLHLHPLTSQRRTFLCPSPILTMTLGAMVQKDALARRHRIGLVAIR